MSATATPRILVLPRTEGTNQIRAEMHGKGRASDPCAVQYGLRALNDGVIGVAQFLDLNERVGGYNGDGRFSARGQGLGDPSFMKGLNGPSVHIWTS